MRRELSIFTITLLTATLTQPLSAALVYEYDAGQDPDGGADTTWEASTDNSGGTNRDWTLNGGATYNSSLSTSTTLTAAYSFDGSDDFGSAGSLGKTPVGGGANTESDSGAAFGAAMWIRPDRTSWDDLGNEVLLESGGGTGFNIRFSAATSGVDLNLDLVERVGGGNVSVTHKLTDADNGTPSDEFVQIVATYGYNGTNYEAELYVNGASAASSTHATRSDWNRGKKGTGLGAAFDALGAAGTAGKFKGDIALVRLYDSMLSDTDVQSNYAAIPEPTSLVLMGLGTVLLITPRRRGQR